jgi:hypothetical protein
MGGAETLQKARGYPQVTIQHERHPFFKSWPSPMPMKRSRRRGCITAPDSRPVHPDPDQEQGRHQRPVLLKALSTWSAFSPSLLFSNQTRGDRSCHAPDTTDASSRSDLDPLRRIGKETQDISLLETQEGVIQLRSAIDPNTTKINISSISRIRGAIKNHCRKPFSEHPGTSSCIYP